MTHENVEKMFNISFWIYPGQEVRVEDDSEEEDDSGPLLDLGDMKVGKKKLAKLEAKAERKAAREAELKEREEKKALEVEKEKERKKLEDLEAQLEKEKEEQIKREAEEKLRKEHEEYLKMKVSPHIYEIQKSWKTVYYFSLGCLHCRWTGLWCRRGISSRKFTPKICWLC